MNKHMIRSALAVATVATGLGASVAAHAEGPYVGGSLGRSDWKDDVNGVPNGSGGTVGKLYGGFKFTPNFALEAGVARLGKIDGNGVNAKGNALFVDAVGILPVAPQWSLLGSAGLATAKVKTSNGNDSGTGLKLGLGAQYDINSNLSVRGQWERYRVSVFNDKPNVDQLSAGVSFAF
jgi:OmpA-OmpF porin, OOP family